MTDRGVSVTINYVLAVGISTILVTGLLIAGGSFVEDSRQRVIENELRVVGTHLAGNMEQVDRMVNASTTDPETAHINQTFQQLVTGSAYVVQLEAGDPPQLVLNASEVEVSVRVNASVRTAVDEDAAASGGPITVYYDDSADELVIDDE